MENDLRIKNLASSPGLFEDSKIVSECHWMGQVVESLLFVIVQKNSMNITAHIDTITK